MEKQKDTCRVCGSYDYLTEEHLIPDCAGNTGPIRARSLSTVNFKTPGWKFSNGMVRRTLCGRCNNLGGRHYVRAFADWTLQAQQYHDRARDTTSALLSLEISPLEVVKQVAVMALAMSEVCSAMAPHYVRLRQFALFPQARGILPRFRFYTYLNYGGPQFDGYHCPFRATEGMGPLVYCHVALEPLGYIITTDAEHSVRWAQSKKLWDLTRYTDRVPNKSTNVYMVLPAVKGLFNS